MKTTIIATWSTWVRLSEYHNFDPYEELDFSIDLGGGNSRDWEYTGDVPEREADHDQNEQFLDEGPSRVEEGDK